MPKVTYMSPDGAETTVDGEDGASVMETAVGAGVDGIVAECGGNMMCATCHVYVDEDWFERTGGREDGEDEMLDETLSPRGETSRLSCQIKLGPELDGIVVRMPEEQA